MKDLGIVSLPSVQPRNALQDAPLRNGLAHKKTNENTELPNVRSVGFSGIEGVIADNSVLAAAFSSKQNVLGYSPLDRAANLSDLTNAALARAALGLNEDGGADIWLHRDGGVLTGTLILGTAYPLQFISTPLQATIVQGMIEYDGKQLYFTPTDTRKTIAVLSHIPVVSTVVANTVTETAIVSNNLPANSLAVAQTLHLLLLGRYSTANAIDTLTIRFKIGGTTLLAIVSTAAAVTNAPLSADLTGTTRTIGTSGTFWSFVQATINNLLKNATATAATTINTTTALALSVTAQWSAADPGNTLSLDQSLLNMS
ncbi:MAG: hypothetical protein M3Q07_12725 [Pseudobdellovibrionaceae bacterium]|nr:hypothetical protein [Pseudobdellovibrionaceae bacterium]